MLVTFFVFCGASSEEWKRGGEPLVLNKCDAGFTRLVSSVHLLIDGASVQTISLLIVAQISGDLVIVAPESNLTGNECTTHIS